MKFPKEVCLCDIEGCNNKGNWASIAIKGRFLPLNVCHFCYQIKKWEEK